MTMGTAQKGLKPLPVATLGRLMQSLGLAAALGPLAVQAQGTAAPAADAVSAPVASSAATTATPTVAATAKWGEGVLEREFLIKLRTFLETDPFDFKAFEAAIGVGFKADPPDGPHPDRSWGMDETRRVLPFGQTFNNRSRGGVRWSFDPGRNSAYLRLEFVKMPPAGKRDGDGLPCMTPELIKEVFAAKWVGTTTYTDFSPMYPGRLPYPIPANQIFRWLPDTPDELGLSYLVDRTCVPALAVSTQRIPPHPATK